MEIKCFTDKFILSRSELQPSNPYHQPRIPSATTGTKYDHIYNTEPGPTVGVLYHSAARDRGRDGPPRTATPTHPPGPTVQGNAGAERDVTVQGHAGTERCIAGTAAGPGSENCTYLVTYQSIFMSYLCIASLCP